MNCQETRELFSEYLDRRLVPGQSRAVEEHVASCPDCHARLAALRKTVSLVGSLDEIESAPDFADEVERRIAGRGWLRRVRSWLWDPVGVKVPLEVTALIILGITAFQLLRSPDFSPPPESPSPPRDRERSAVPRRADVAKKERRAEQAESKQPSVKTEEPAAPAPSASSEQSVRELRAGGRQGPMKKEIVARDITVYQQKVRALLAEFGGRQLREEGAPDQGLILTVELPQSRVATFLARVSVEAGAKPKGEPAALEALRSAQNIETKAADQTRAAPAEEPRVTLELHILPDR